MIWLLLAVTVAAVLTTEPGLVANVAGFVSGLTSTKRKER